MKRFRTWLTALLVLVLVFPASQAFAASLNDAEAALPGGKEAISLTGKLNLPATQFSEGIQLGALNSDQAVLEFANSQGSGKGLVASGKQFIIDRKGTDSLDQEHYVLQQSYRGIPVYGRYMQINLNKANEIYAIQDKSDNGLSLSALNTSPTLTPDEAISVFKKDVESGLSGAIQLETKAGFYQVSAPTASTIIYPYKGKSYLAYKVNMIFMFPTAGNWIGYVDAHTGQVIDKYNKLQHATGSGYGNDGESKPLNTTPYNGQYILWDQTHVGDIYTLDLIDWDDTYLYFDDIYSSNNIFDNSYDADAVDAHYNADLVYDFYKSNYGRESIDGAGMDVYSIVHVPDFDDEGNAYIMDNAYWNGEAMFYGDGTGSSNGGFDCLSCGLDVVAHELTHGVTEFTAGLEYRFQSGALNESISDIMAAVIDNDDWLIGEDTGLTIRDMVDPETYDQPGHMEDYVVLEDTEDEDWGGVHINSGIPNHAAYLMAGKFNAKGLSGRSLLGKLTYQALKYYLVETSDFRDMKNAYLLAAGSVSGLNSAQRQLVKQAIMEAWDEVGIGEPVKDLKIVNQTANSVQMSWTAVSDAESVTLLYSDNNRDWYDIGYLDNPNGNLLTLTDIPTNKTYYFALYVHNGSSVGASNTVSVKLKAGKINSFTLGTKTYDTATFNWSVSDVPGNIIIQQSVDSGKNWITSSISGSLTPESTSATVNNLETGKTYKFRLGVSGTAYTSTQYSTILSVPITPVPVMDLAASGATGNSTALTWTPAVGATSIVVQQSLNGTSWTNAVTGTLAPNAGNATVTGLLSGTVYKFRVVATGGRNAGNSNVASSTTLSVPLLDLRVSSTTSNTAVLAWPAAVRAKTIYVEYSANGGAWKEQALKVSGTAKTATVKGLLPNTEYQFRLQVAEGANAGTSNTAAGVTKPVPLKSFASTGRTNLKAESAEFKWSLPIGATTLTIEQSTNGKDWTTAITDSINPTATSATVRELTPTTKYYFRLNVVGGQNEGPSNSVTVTTIPLPLSDLSVDEGETTGSKVALNWTAAIGAKKVVIQQSLNGKSWTTAKVASPLLPGDSSAVVTGLAAGTDYDFRITVTGGQNAGNSNIAEESTKIVPIDSLRESSSTTNSVTLAWDAASKATAIGLQQNVGGGWEPVAGIKLSVSANSVTIRGLTPNTGYAYRLVVTGGGNDGESNEVEVRTKSLAISGFASTGKTSNSASFKWKPVTGAGKVYIEYVGNGQDWVEAVSIELSTDSVTATVDGLTSYTSYKFRLRVEEGLYEGSSTALSVKTNR
ncbi:fibronectin type III domain-containing protein [Paenibacillus sp. YIM B09110]|uniref:fibronectin type III domain-containing protein n=1 Tax=Paenibacillus sp. YIM B09110 TaxID=3126102 RepID=UPI00301D9B94